MSNKVNMPFHLFKHRGSTYVINIEGMTAHSVDEATARNLKMLTANPDKPLDLDMVKDPEKPKKEPFPITGMALFLTQSCNLKCIYCYGEGGSYGTGGSLDEKTALQSVDWLIEQSRKVIKINIVFFGGEPFLNFPLMKTVVKYAQQRVNELGKKVKFHLTTNATLLNDEIISFLKEHNVNAMISLDGPKEIQDRQRPFVNGKGSYDVIVPKIKKLLAVLPETRGHAVIADATDPLIVKEALKEIGFLNITTAIMSASLFDEKLGELKPEREMNQLLNLMELEAEEWLNHTKNRATKALLDLASTGHLYEGIVFMLHNRKKHYPCQAGLGFVGVSCAGDVYPCQRFVGLDKYKLGSVFTQNLDRDSYHKSPRTYIKECGSCFAQYYCAGGCKYMNAVSGDSVFKQAKVLCRLKRRVLELSAYIYCLLDQQDHAFLIEHKVVPPKLCPLDFS
ncbi:MAG: nif11-like peptide radical SAM maturase [Carboxydocellales bacterium]